MKQLSLDIAEIKNIISDKYTSRNKASLICLADEKTHHILYSGDSYELGKLIYLSSSDNRIINYACKPATFHSCISIGNPSGSWKNVMASPV